MRQKGKVIKWDAEKAFGFIAPNNGEKHVFIHKTALKNKNRTPKVNDTVTFSKVKDKQGRYCARNATFLGEKLKERNVRSNNKFSIYFSLLFLSAIIIAYLFSYFPLVLLYVYIGSSVVTFVAYGIDKSKAKSGKWRTQESTLHLLSFIGGWPGAALAQQLLRHKSAKKEFRRVFWFTAIANVAGLMWLYSSMGDEYLKMLFSLDF